jgi:hypothetical protein
MFGTFETAAIISNAPLSVELLQGVSSNLDNCDNRDQVPHEWSVSLMVR